MFFFSIFTCDLLMMATWYTRPSCWGCLRGGRFGVNRGSMNAGATPFGRAIYTLPRTRTVSQPEIKCISLVAPKEMEKQEMDKLKTNHRNSFIIITKNINVISKFLVNPDKT